jgi:hypothetical protein
MLRAEPIVALDNSGAQFFADAHSRTQGFNPKYNKFSLAAPKVAHTGDTIHTHCEWQNSTTKPITFPTEMCAGVTFYFPAHGQMTCTEGAFPTN